MNLEWLRVVVTSVLLAFLSIVGTGCANGVDEKPAPSIASDTTDWELLGNSSDMQHHSGLSQVRHRLGVGPGTRLGEGSAT